MYGGKFAFQDQMGQLLVGREFTIFALFYFVFEGKFQLQALRGSYIRRGDLTEGFLRYDLGGLIFRGACTWSGLFSEFYCMLITEFCPSTLHWGKILLPELSPERLLWDFFKKAPLHSTWIHWESNIAKDRYNAGKSQSKKISCSMSCNSTAILLQNAF